MRAVYFGFLHSSNLNCGECPIQRCNSSYNACPHNCLQFHSLIHCLQFLDELNQLSTFFRPIKTIFTINFLRIGLSYKTVVLIGYFITLLFGLISLGFLLVDRKILLSLLFGMGILIFIIFYNIIKSEFMKK